MLFQRFDEQNYFLDHEDWIVTFGHISSISQRVFCWTTTLLDTPEERIIELEYLQKLPKMDRGRKKAQNGRKRSSTLVGFGATPGNFIEAELEFLKGKKKHIWRKNCQNISIFNVNYECTDWRCPMKPSSRNMKKTTPRLIITKFLKNFERAL